LVVAEDSEWLDDVRDQFEEFCEIKNGTLGYDDKCTFANGVEMKITPEITPNGRYSVEIDLQNKYRDTNDIRFEITPADQCKAYPKFGFMCVNSGTNGEHSFSYDGETLIMSAKHVPQIMGGRAKVVTDLSVIMNI